MNTDIAGGQDMSDRHTSMGGGAEDYSSGYRKNLGEFEEYVKMMKDEIE